MGISHDFSSGGSRIRCGDNEDDAGTTGTGASKPESRTAQDSPIDGDATLRGNPIPEKAQDVGHNDGGDPEPSVSMHRFRFRKRKDGKRERNAWRGRKMKHNVEAGEVLQEDMRSGGFGLSSNEQIILVDAVLAEENANEVCCISLRSSSYQKQTPTALADIGSGDYATGNRHS